MAVYVFFLFGCVNFMVVLVLTLIALEMCKYFFFEILYTCGHTTDYKSLFQYQSCIKRPAGSGLDITENFSESRNYNNKTKEMHDFTLYFMSFFWSKNYLLEINIEN